MQLPKYLEGVNYIPVDMDDHFAFECQRCGSCCTRPPPILPQEIDRMSSYLNMSRQKFFDSFCRGSQYTGLLNLEKTGSHCTFYVDRGACVVHDEKPGSCMSLPIKGRYVFTGNPSDVEHPERIAIASCMGTGDGPFHLVSEFMEEFCPPEHISNHAAIMLRFIDHLGGIDAANELAESNLINIDDEVRRKVREFTEREYGIRVR